MIEYKVVESTVKNGGGTLTCEMGELGWKDLLMLKRQSMVRPKRKTQDTKIKAGSFWRPNAELRKRTHGDSTHAYHDDAYLLQAAGEHVKLNEETEADEMRKRISEATDFSLILLNYRAYTAEELTTVFEAQTARVIALSAVRDEQKIAAREMMAETLDVTDSTGRMNPVAKAMQSGGANGRFRRRRQNALDIRNYEIVRTKRVSDMIQCHLDLYMRFWKALSMSAMPEDDADPKQIFEKSSGLQNGGDSLLSDIRGQAGLDAAHQRIKVFRDSFASIRIRPFCKNAAHVVRELDDVIEKGFQKGDRAEILSRLRKIRRGIRWIFALDALQMEVILPYSILLDGLRRIIKRERGADGTFTRGPIVIPRSAAPHLFAKIEKSLHEVRSKIRSRCSDMDLDRRDIKDDVESYLGTAADALATDDWQTAKNCLLRAARCL